MGSILKDLNNIKVVVANMENEEELDSIINILNIYKNDGMGDSPPYTSNELLLLKYNLQNNPCVIIFLAYFNNNLAAGSICFETFSTFTSKSIINIHDICVTKEYRGFGIGRKLMESIISKSEKLGCGKITLEVREDNAVAQELYNSVGFKESTPKMYFWSRKIDTCSVN